MSSVVRLLAENPLLLLFLVAAIGYPIGQCRLAGTNLGVGAVLFAGLAIGALDPSLKLPEMVYLLGLVLFVYTVGLASGPSFFAALVSGRGIRINVLVIVVLATAAGLTLAMQRVLHLSAPMAAGMFAGTLTNTPTLAAQLDFLRHAGADSAEPIVAYSLTYPVGVLGAIVALMIARRQLRPPAPLEPERTGITMVVARVTNRQATSEPLGSLAAAQRWRVSLGRFKRGDELRVATPDVRLRVGDLVTVVGPPSEIARIVAWIGEASAERIDRGHSDLDLRRIVVSNRAVAGRELGDLDLPGRFGAVATRLRRGDVDFVPDDHTVIEPGDRLRVLAHRDAIGDVTRFFGDSYRALSEIDVLTFSVGCALGLGLGLVPIPLPGGLNLRLGLAGGPLIVALVLGRLGRTGPILWTLPFSANLTLRQLGLILFLAGIGTRAGDDFVHYLVHGGGLLVFAAGAGITLAAATLTLWAGATLLRLPFGLLAGTLAGLQTQPAVLGFAIEQTKDESPNVGYATVYPVAMIAKVLIGQILLAVMR
ncbi:MAG: aspartate:alanine exchanger family transporter [Acidobacteriota bacterium]